MLISFKVLTLRAAIDLQISLKSSSGQTENKQLVVDGLSKHNLC